MGNVKSYLAGKYQSYQFSPIITKSNNGPWSWVKRYLDKENKGKWKSFCHQQLTWTYFLKAILMRKNVKSFLKRGTFLNDVLVSWCKLNAIHCKNDSNIGKQVIWNNSNIKLKHMKSAKTVNTFKSMLKKHLFYTN